MTMQNSKISRTKNLTFLSVILHFDIYSFNLWSYAPKIIPGKSLSRFRL